MECPQCGKVSDGAECPSCGAAMDEQNPKWYAEGIVHLTKEKQYSFAHELLAEGLQKFPESAMLWYNGGVLEELLGNRQKAVKCYEESLRLRPNSEKPRLALERLLGRSLQPSAPAPAAAPAPRPAAPVPTAAPVAAMSVPQTPAPKPPAQSAPSPATATPSAGEMLAAQINAVVAEDAATVTPPVERTARFMEPTPPTRALARESLDLASLPQLPEDASPSFDVIASNQRWTMISRLAGIASAATFVGLMVFLVLAKIPSFQQTAATLFIVDLVIFLFAAPVYFVGKSSVIVTRKQRV
ncbi:MAG: hypothetical protein ACYDBB_12345 [Armatimonadota bacterium]